MKLTEDHLQEARTFVGKKYSSYNKNEVIAMVAVTIAKERGRAEENFEAMESYIELLENKRLEEV